MENSHKARTKDGKLRYYKEDFLLISLLLIVFSVLGGIIKECFYAFSSSKVKIPCLIKGD